jgi:hypothetical protein
MPDITLIDLITYAAFLFSGAGATRVGYHKKIRGNGDDIEGLRKWIEEKFESADKKMENKFDLVFKVIRKNEKLENDRNELLTKNQNEMKLSLTDFMATINTSNVFKDEKVEKLEKSYSEMQKELNILTAKK